MRAIRLGHSLSDVSLLRALYSVRCHTWSAFRWFPRKVPKKKVREVERERRMRANQL